MKLKLCLLPAMLVYCMLISATSIKVSPKYNEGESKYISEIKPRHKTVKPKKLNFFQKLVLRLAIKKYKKAHHVDNSNADNLATTSLASGAAALAFLVLGLFVPYIIIASIPAAIIAMITGGAALRKGTKKTGTARTGKAFGLGALIAFGVLIILAAIIVSTWDFSWGVE